MKLYNIFTFRTMDRMFQEHHPKKGLRKGPGLFQDFFKKLQKHFGSEYHDKVLFLVVKVLTRFRARTINLEAKLAKKKGARKTAAVKKAAKLKAKVDKKARARVPQTLAGKRRLAEMTFQK